MLNKCILMGRLTRDPILRNTQTGTAVTSFSIAVDRSFGKSGEQKQADFFDIVCWEKRAEFAANYLTKGTQIVVVGRLQQKNWVDKEGNKRTSVEIVADEINFTGSKRDNEANGESPYAAQPREPYNAAPRPQAAEPPAAPPAGDPTGFAELMDDDGNLPF